MKEEERENNKGEEVYKEMHRDKLSFFLRKN